LALRRCAHSVRHFAFALRRWRHFFNPSLQHFGAEFLEIASLLRFQILVDFALSELLKKAYNKIGGMFIFRRFCAWKKLGRFCAWEI
jgi:hypothetical protein